MRLAPEAMWSRELELKERAVAVELEGLKADREVRQLWRYQV